MTDTIQPTPTLTRADIQLRIREHEAVIAELLPDARSRVVQADITALQARLQVYRDQLENETPASSTPTHPGNPGLGCSGPTKAATQTMYGFRTSPEGVA